MLVWAIVSYLIVCVNGKEFASTTNGINFFLVFDYMLNESVDYSRYNFVWGASETMLLAESASNPQIITSKYIPWNRDPDAKSSLYWKIVYPDWILYKCDRISPAYLEGEAHMPLDFTNPRVIEWQYSNYAIPASTSQYDAIAADNFSFNNEARACGIWKNKKWVPKYTGELYDRDYARDAAKWLIDFRFKLHSQSSPLLFGVNFSLDQNQTTTSPEVATLINTVDYVLDEKGFSNWGESKPDEATWLNTHYFIEALQWHGKAYFSINEFTNVTQENKEWAIASYLMSNHNLSSVVAVGVQEYGYETYLPEYAQLDIGSPVTFRMKSKDIYFRSYTNGLVIVNTNNSSRTVSVIGIDSRDVYGNVFPSRSPIVLPPLSGKVLAISKPVTYVSPTQVPTQATIKKA